MIDVTRESDVTATERAATVSRVWLDVENEPLPASFAVPSVAELHALADWMGAWDAVVAHTDSAHGGIKDALCCECFVLDRDESTMLEQLERIEQAFGGQG